MIRALMSGRLFKAAEAKTGASGKAYATASMVLDVPDGQPRFARVTAFGELAERLLALAKGDALAVAGRIEISVWAPDGKAAEAQVRIVADDIATLPSAAHKRGSDAEAYRRASNGE